MKDDLQHKINRAIQCIKSNTDEVTHIKNKVSFNYHMNTDN